jgi:cell wall-associated NlpC family hydrolase/phage-related protein
MAFDAGTIIAHLDVDDDDANRKLDRVEQRVRDLEGREIKLKVRVADSDINQARRDFERMDRNITNDAHRRGGLLSLLMGGRDGRGSSFGRTMSNLLSTSPGGSNQGHLGRLFGAAGPGFGPLGARGALIASAIPLAGATLPALAGVGAVGGVGAIGAGVIGLGAKALIGTKKDPGALYQPAQQLAESLKDTFTKAAQPMLAPLRQAFGQIPGMLRSLLPELKSLFAGAATLIQPLLHGLMDIARDVLPGLAAAFRAVAPSIRPLLDGVGGLVKGLLPGLVSLLKAAHPAIVVFAQILGTLGRDLGQMFRILGPAMQASARVLKAIFDVIGGLLPVIARLADVFAKALAPVIGAFATAIRALQPALIIVGRVLAQLAGAVLKDLSAALIAVARLVAGIAPSLAILGRILGQVFDTLESSGLFGALAAALEKLAAPLAQLINLLVRQMMPVLPIIITLFVQLSGILIQLLAAGLGTIISLITTLLKHMPFLVPLITAITAVWLAWDLVMAANPIGLIIIAIVALIGAITLLATHWHRVWTDVKNWAEDAWKFLTHGWGQWLIPGLTLVRLAVQFLRDHWKQAWDAIKGAGLAAWHFIHDDIFSPLANFMTKTLPGAFRTSVSYIGKAWDGLRNAVKTPVKFVIGTVLDGLIGTFDWITSHMGLGSPIRKVDVSGWQTGGRIPGYGGGDRNLALLEGGEAVVSKETSSAHARELASWGVPGFQTGGRIGQHPIGASQARTGLDPTKFHGTTAPLAKVGDIGKILAAIATANTKALSNAISDLIPHGVGGASADLAAVLTKAPAMLLADAVHWLISHGGGEGLGGRGPEIAKYAMSFAGKIPYTWGGTSLSGCDCSGFTGAIYHHFGIHAPRTSEAQGAWVKKSGAVTGGLAFYHSPPGGPDPGHVALVGFNGNVISQGGGMGPQIQPLRSMPLLFTGVPPGGAGFGPGNLRGLESIWTGAGGSPSSAHIAAAIGMAESGGREVKQAGQPPGLTGWGIWQITPTSGIWNNGRFGNLLNDSNNARAAVYLWRQAGGFSPWATYNSGAYQQFMDGGGWLSPGPNMIMNATRRGEAVLTPSQSRAFIALSEAAESFARGPGQAGGGLMRDIYLQLPEGTTVAQALREISWLLRTSSQQGYTGVR